MRGIETDLRHLNEIREYNCQTRQGPLTYLQHGSTHVVLSPLKDHLIVLSPTLAAYTAALAAAPTDIIPASRLDALAYLTHDYATDPSENGQNRVKKYISVLRALLGETQESPIIFCVPGQGYTLTPPNGRSDSLRTTVRKGKTKQGFLKHIAYNI